VALSAYAIEKKEHKDTQKAKRIIPVTPREMCNIPGWLSNAVRGWS
jgi:hypothetical protein